MRRLLPLAVGVALLAALVLAATTSAGTRQRVALGDYVATLNLPEARGWVQGRFTVEKSKGKRAMAPTPEFGAIFYPDANECEDLAAPLVAQKVPIRRDGRFRIRERTQGDTDDQIVTWSGRWTDPRTARGKIVIRYGECVSRLRWAGARLP